MPQIHEYTAPEGIGLRPTETGVESTAAAARRVGGAYSESAQLTKEAGNRIGSAVQEALTTVGDYQARQEISHGAAALAGLANSKTKQWRETSAKADPNDPTVAQNYQQSVEADLTKFKSGFLTQKGQDWAESRIEALRSHLYAKSNSDRATAAGHARGINANTTVQGLANMAMWDPTEKGLQAALDQLNHSNLPAPVIEEGKKQIIERNAAGYVRQNAAQPDYMQKPEYRGYLDARETDKLVRIEKQTRDQNRATEKYDRAQAESQARQAYNTQADNFYQATLPVNNESRPQLPTDYKERLDKMQPAPDAPRDVHTAYQNLLKHVDAITDRLNKPEPASAISARTAADVVTKIHSGEITSEAQITELFGQGLLNSRHYNFARKEFEELRTDTGVRLTQQKAAVFDSVKKMITKSNSLMGTMDQSGDAQFLRYKEDVSAKITQYRAAGKDPFDLLDPSKPEFVGKPAAIAPFQKPLNQSMQDAANQLRTQMGRPAVPALPPTTVVPPVAPTPAPAPPPAVANPKLRKPGETPDEYDARVNARIPAPARPTAPPPGGI